MEQKPKENKLKIVIIVLAVLLAFSLAALAGTLIYNRWAGSRTATVTVPDNFITPDETSQANDNEAGYAETSETDLIKKAEKEDKTANPVKAGKGQSVSKNQSTSQTTASSGTGGSGRQAVSLSLYNRKTQENTAFQVDNMFPGDSETQYFRVQVSYQNPITVRYHADVQKGYEKLAEVLNLRINLLSAGEVLYDGPIGDMPESLDCRLNGSSKTTEELYYEITAYLDTSVGNDYQNLGLAANFRWWVEETGNLTKPPKTGDTFNPMLLAAVAVISGAIVILLVINRRRRRDERYE